MVSHPLAAMSLPDLLGSLWYIPISLLLVYGVVDAFSTRNLVKRQAQYPLIGTPFTFVPKFILNLFYAWKATALAGEGYEKVYLFFIKRFGKRLD